MKLTLRIWRQSSADQPGGYQSHQLENVSNLSLLEALDQLNEQLISAGERPVSFEHDCREGICGSCGFLVNGQAHGPRAATSVCQLYLREFNDGAVLTLDPWRAKAFPPIQDLMVDRSAFDRLIAAGGYCSTGTGQAPDGNALPVGREQATSAFAPQPASAVAPASPVAAMPRQACSWPPSWRTWANSRRGNETERPCEERMTQEGFGSCSSNLECEAVCPQEISADPLLCRRRCIPLHRSAAGHGESLVRLACPNPRFAVISAEDIRGDLR